MKNIKEIIILTILFCATVIVGWYLISPSVGDEKNLEIYENALTDYNSGNYSNAYYQFSLVKRGSDLKPYAIYKQGLSAQKLGDYKGAIRNYNKLIFSNTDKELLMRARYLKAQSLFELGEFDKAHGEFEGIIKKYPKTDYEIASHYFLGAIDIKEPKNSEKTADLFRYYLKNSHDGKYSVASGEKLALLNPTKEDNFLIAKAYYANGDYETAQKFLNLTNPQESWTYLIKNSYMRKNYQAVKGFTEVGLIKYAKMTAPSDVYEVVDLYIKTQSLSGLNYLMETAKTSSAYDYINYRYCNSLNYALQEACFNTFYYKYPLGQFSGEALSRIFMAKALKHDYKNAKHLGKEHLRKFFNTNSAPMVLYWLGKVNEATGNSSEAKSYYISILENFPDDYYAYKANLKVGQISHANIEDGLLQIKEVEFPYDVTKMSKKEMKILGDLVKVADYELINDLYKDNKFIQSWLADKNGKFSTSSVLAREAMENLPEKPLATDIRWRLIYPIHFYNDIKKTAENVGNNPVLMLSLMKEESHFNYMARSSVGAIGLMQLMPATALDIARNHQMELFTENLYDPRINIKLGNYYYAQLRNQFKDKDEYAILAYNGGSGSVFKWLTSLQFTDTDEFIERIPYSETRNYIKKVFKAYWNYKRIYR